MISTTTTFSEDERPRSAADKTRKPRHVERRVISDFTQPFNLARFAYFTVTEVADFMSMSRDWVDLRFKEHRQGDVLYPPTSSASRGHFRRNKKYLIPYATLIAFLQRHQGKGKK